MNEPPKKGSLSKSSSAPLSISCILLAYAEEDNLRILLPLVRDELSKAVDDFEIIVVDAAKPLDASESVCREHSVKYMNQREPYFGGALRTGIREASKDYFLTLDADCSCNPKDIPLLIERMIDADCDMVIGSRYANGGDSDGTLASYLMSKFLNGAFRRAIKVDARDLSINYRLYKTSALQSIELTCTNYDILEEIILKLKLQKESIQDKGPFLIEEVPIGFEKRAFGHSKRRLIRFIMTYLKTLIWLWALRVITEKQKCTMLEAGRRAEFVANAGLYFIIGCIGAVIDYLAFSLVILITGWPAPDMIFQFVGIAELANVIGALFGSLVCFYLNSFYNFIAKDHLVRRYVSYVAVCFLGTFISTSLMFLLKPYMSVYIVKLICVATGAVVQFLLNRRLTFRKVEEDAPC